MSTHQRSIFDAIAPEPKRRAFHAAHANVSPEEYAEETKRAASQEARVLALFRLKRLRLTPWHVSEWLGICENSARRAMSNLTYAGLLVKLPDRVPAGPHGKKSHLWMLKTEPNA